MSTFCTGCGDVTVSEYDATSGTTFCTSCGAVQEESAIVNEIQFGETAGGAAIVSGSYVAAGAAGPGRVGPRGRGGTESREVTLNNGKAKIRGIANGLTLSDMICDSAQRTFVLAVSHQFTKGRRTEYVAAACLYVACRQEGKNNNLMLIDFSDFLQINVFVLGATYLKLVKELVIQLPLIDPSVYISRFAHLLEFGEETQSVASDATRLVQRFNRDWMDTGRRPAGICGAALVLAARMNNFRRSVAEVVQVVKIADVTIKKRLDEFKHTAGGRQSVQEFREHWLEEYSNPPAFIENQKKEAAQKKRAQRMLTDGLRSSAAPTSSRVMTAFNELAAEETEGAPVLSARKEKGKGKGKAQPDPNEIDPEDAELVDEAIEGEIQASLQSSEGTRVANECEQLDEERQRLAEEHQLNDEALDEEELDVFILSPDEVKEKERLWIEMNKDYLQQVAEKQRYHEGDDQPRRPRKRKRKQLADSSNAQHSTAAESTKHLLQKKQKASRKLNYSALEGLFDTGPTGGDKERADTADLEYPRARGQQQYRSESPEETDGRQPTQALAADDDNGEEEEEQEEDDVVQEMDYDPSKHTADAPQQEAEGEGEGEEEDEDEEAPNYDEDFTHDADAIDIEDM